MIPQRGSVTRRYRIALMVLDIPTYGQGVDEEIEIISKCDLIADWIVMNLRENPPQILQIGSNVDVLSLVEYGGDLWAGVRVEFDIITPMPIGACDVRNA